MSEVLGFFLNEGFGCSGSGQSYIPDPLMLLTKRNEWNGKTLKPRK